MTGVPPPRTEGSGLLNYIADSVRDLGTSMDRGFEGIRRELSELPRQYVPRLEVDRRFDELGIDVGEMKAKYEAAERDRAQAARDAEVTRRSTRRWLVTTTVAAASSLAGVVGGITVHFH